MVCKIRFCSELPDVTDKAGIKMRRKTLAIAKRYAFHANAKTYPVSLSAYFSKQYQATKYSQSNKFSSLLVSSC